MAKATIKVGVLSEEEIKRAASRPQSRDRKARIGFIGAGWWATTNHMPVLKARKDVLMVSACGLDAKVLERCRRDFGFEHVTDDYRELLRQDLDGVVIASPHGLHAEHALAALAAGCHIMVEKPLSTDVGAARRIVALAQRKGRHVVVPHGWQYRPLNLRAKRLMEENVVGEVEFVLCHMASPLKNLFSGKSFDFQDGAYVDAKLSTWADPRISKGGYGQGQLSHALSLMVWLTGLKGSSVYANMSRPGAKVDMYDALSLRFSGGAVGTVSGAATLPMHTPGSFQLDMRIFGEKGMLMVDIGRNHLSFDTHDGRHEAVALKAGDGAYQCDGPPNQFVELILGLTCENNSPGEVAMRAVEILDAAYRSDGSGKKERV